MPRPSNNSLLALFKCNDLNQIVCYNENCDGKALYKHSANLERHLKKIHPFIYSSYVKKKKILKFPRKPNFEKRIIDLMRDYPILWNKFDEDRFNEILTNKAWREISHNMDVTVHMAKKKWDNLLEKFRSELNQNPQTPAGADTGKSSTTDSMKYFSELLFLRDHIDLTKRAVDIQPEHMENMKMDYIKEESSESFTQYNETLEDSSQVEYGDESIVQDDREESRLIDDVEESRQQDDKEASLPPNENGDPKLRHGTKISSMKQSKIRPALDETDSEDDYIHENPKKMKRKKMKLMSESENSDTDEPDSDRMFLLSLLPFMKAIPNKKKLFVRHRIQGVLLEEQQKSW